jgi:hypothetical protein
MSTSSDPSAQEARRADRRAGSLVAQALGDALGFVVEGEHPRICANFATAAFALTAPSHGRGPFAFGQYCDDTQLARELALSLVEARGWDPPHFARRLAALFASETIVGRGRATEAAAHRLLRGVPWDQSGEPPPSAGNGAAMRAAPVGLFFPDDADQRFRVADEQARITHRDPRAWAAAVQDARHRDDTAKNSEPDPHELPADSAVRRCHRVPDFASPPTRRKRRADRPRLATATRGEIQVPPWERPDSTTPFAPSTARCSARRRSPVRSASTRRLC